MGSATNRDVNGPINTPPSRYPTNGGNRKRAAARAPISAAMRLRARVAIREVS